MNFAERTDGHFRETFVNHQLIVRLNDVVPDPTSQLVSSGSTNIRVTLDNRELWNKFSACGTEMIITKTGR